MKAKILTLAILFGVSFSSYAATSNTIDSDTTLVEMALAQDNGYKVVDVKDLEPVIQQAIATYEESFIIETIEYNETELLTRLTLISKSDEIKSVVILDKEGKELPYETEE